MCQIARTSLLPRGRHTLPGDTCGAIEDQYSLRAGTVKSANDFVTRGNIWTWTPSCTPLGPYKASRVCRGGQALDAAYGLVPGMVLGRPLAAIITHLPLYMGMD
jgi:hypothetical protein